MTSRKRKWLIGSILILILLSSLMFFPLSEIEQHRRYVLDSRAAYAKPDGLGELFSMQTLGYLRQKRTTEQQRQELGKQHEDALIQLGYFERRSYPFSNIDTTAFTQALRRQPVHDRLYFFEFHPDHVAVLAYKNDYSIIEPLLRDFANQKKP
jgi:hypothetical protein